MSFNVFNKVLTNEYELIAKETLYARNIYSNIFTSLLVVSICPSKDRINFWSETSMEALFKNW